MAKMALVIGVSDYEPGLTPLPGSARDVEAMQRVLQQPDVGGFNEVKMLLNPTPQEMQEAIETLFSGRKKDDLVLLFFSGHGVKDDNGKLHLATRITRKTPQGELIRATAVPASFVQDIMSNSRSKRQVVILDCCFSGAFAEGWLAKDDGSVDVKSQLGGEGRAVLTSSTSTQYSFEQEGSDLSIYTRYLVEGIVTGAADIDSDGVVSIDELHEYAKGKVQEAAPAMKPEIYAVKEGYKIRLFQAPIEDPKLRYRKEVEHFAIRGMISVVGRNTLDALRDGLGLLPEVAAAIEDEVLKPYREYQKRLQRYEQVLVEAIGRESSLSSQTQNELKHLQRVLQLRDEDIALIEAQITSQKKAIQPLSEPKELIQAETSFRSEDVTLINPSNTVLAPSQAEITTPPRIRTPRIQPISATFLSNRKLLIGASIAISLAFVTYLGVTLSRDQPIESPASIGSPSSSSSSVSSLELYNQAFNKQNQGDKQGAIADYTQAIQINQDWGADNPDTNYYGIASTYLNRGLVHYLLGEFRPAFENFQQAISLKSDLAIAYYYRGLARYFSDADHKGAVRDLMQGIAINKNWGYTNPAANYFGRASAHFSLGDINSELGNIPEAIKNYQEAVPLFQKRGEILNAQKAQDRIKELQRRSQ
ncbi:caspase, EACC1-associated type [Nostoc parmelioides]|uniref:Caspase family protein n=1 Tax=Nostoc parmelioides FACHB-3921 TaxID=2692909 RepID=A0ABR8BEE2_9NOSO|nr:caspase family protein [Nostoc parmelioides]MBD2252462.1 caspase family protein [Nostoc parmelioides FACHB-3921]